MEEISSNGVLGTWRRGEKLCHSRIGLLVRCRRALVQSARTMQLLTFLGLFQ